MSPMTPPDFSRSFAEYCRTVADWRRRKADEYDRDPRNLRVAEGLEALAEYVVQLPAGDPRLRELIRLTVEGDLFRPDQRVHYELGRFRFHHPEAGLDPFLDTLVELAMLDKGEQGRFGGRLPEGDDPWA